MRKRIWKLDRRTKKPVTDFHLGQQRTWDSKARYPLMLAGAQSGKTTFGPLWLGREISETHDPEGGENDYLAVTTSYPLFALKMMPALLDWFCVKWKIGRYWPGLRVIELRDPRTRKYWAKRATDPMWGRIILLSIGTSGGIVAVTARGAWLDELGQDAWDANDFRDIQLRLALHQGRALGTTTPYNSGYVKTEWYDRWKDGDPEYEVIQFPSTENPSFPQEEYDKAERTLPEWRFRMFFKGEFARPAGLIYNAFQDWMLFDPRAFDRKWSRVCGTDFGGANTAQLWLAEDDTVDPTVWYVYDEYLGGGVSTREHAQRTLTHDGDLSVDYFGGAGSETQERMDWVDNGVNMKLPPVGRVEIGISRVIELMKDKRLRVSRKCKGLLHEIETYSRKLDEAGLPTEEIVQKRKFHRLDALRAAADGIFGELKEKKKKAKARARV